MTRIKPLIILQDTQTGELLSFTTLQNASDYINNVTGSNLGPSAVYGAIKRCGTLAKKRFKSCVDPDKWFVEPNRYFFDDDWEFSQFSVSHTVIVAEKRLDWYDEERIEEINEGLRDFRCRVFWDMTCEGYQRKRTRVEIYKKFPEEVPFEEKVKTMQEIITSLHISA